MSNPPGSPRKVEHEAGEVALLVQVAQRLRHVFAGALLELDDAQIAVTGFEHLGAHAANVDDLARQGEGQRLVGLLARNREHDLRAGLAAHLLDRAGQRQTAGGGLVDLDDQVAGLDAGAKRGRILDRRDDLDEAVFHADLDAQAAELALRRYLQFLVGIGVEEVGVRVQPVDHAVDGFFDQFFICHRFDIVALDATEYGGEQLQILVGNGQPGFTIGQRREVQAEQQPEHRAQADQACFFPAITHVRLVICCRAIYLI